MAMSLDLNRPKKSAFIWMEALGCGELLAAATSSYLAHHDQPLHVIGYHEDLISIKKHELIIPIEINSEKGEIDLTDLEAKAAYQYGHRGTALLWSKLILHRKEDFLIHLDADNIFVGEILSPILEALNNGYAVTGTRRPYRYRFAKGGKFAGFIHFFRRDCVNTHCFGFNRSLVGLRERSIFDFIEGRARNKYTPRILPIIDFFDRMTFYLARRGGVFYQDSNNQEPHGHHSRLGRIESNLISFSAVGSGIAFYKNRSVTTSATYIDFAIKSYALYSKYVIGKVIDYEVMESPYLIQLLERLDKQNWKLLPEGIEK
jgi:hypothetical protein